MDLSYAAFLAAFFLSLAVAIVVGVILVVRWRNLFVMKALMSFRYNWLYVVLIILFPIVVKAIEYLQGRISDPANRFDEVVYTNWMFNLSGGAIRVLQDRLNSRLLTDLFIVVYVWLFAYVTAFPPVLLFAKDDRRLMRRYAIAMLFNGLILTPFYALFPVSVTGSHPESGMTPLLYISVDWGRMVLSIDPLDNDFPSGHVSLALTTFLIFALAGFEYRKVAYFFAGATAAIVFSVLYLGIHWPPDVFAGFLVGVAATALSGVQRIQMTIDRYVRLVSLRLFGIQPDEATAPMKE
jgi:membrane-associated phospholipid phosphatase